MERLNITLDELHAEKLSRLAESMRVPERAQLGLAQARAGRTVALDEW